MRRPLPVDKAKEAFIDSLAEKSEAPDQDGSPAISSDIVVTDTSIDRLLARGLTTIDRLLKKLSEDVVANTFDRNTVQNLKDCMAMLADLKEYEDDFLRDADSETLEKASKD